MSKSQKSKSKYFSMILRHKPEAIGLQLDDEGWADTSELLAKVKISMSIDELQSIVATNDKQRFALSADCSRIRANQGHSVKVNLNLSPITPPETLYHGTATRFVASIKADGLLPRGRQHVHSLSDRDTAIKVGQRHGKPIAISVLAGKLHREGQQFFRSENGVWLTATVSPHALTFPQ